MSRGRLRIYLGAAPGVGKTVRMLQEGRRRRDRGTDVVVGLVETHDRAYTAEQIGDLPLVPRCSVQHRGTHLDELDVDAVLARRPEVVLVDELAHTNTAGSRHERRWEDIEELLSHGIDVISTVNVQHLESLNDVVREITGVRQRETVPDAVVRSADQIELVDMAPEALRRRLAHGNVYGADKVDAALSNYFRPGNLSALRELALVWVADRVDEALLRYRSEHDIRPTWAARERVVVALTGGPEQDTLLRRGARLADRGAGGELIAVQVVTESGLRETSPDSTAAASALTEKLGGRFHTVTSDDVGEAILEFARGVNASQIVVGASRRSRWQQLFGRGVGETVVAGSGEIDVLMVTHPLTRSGRSAGISMPGLGRRRTMLGFLLSTVGVALLTLVLDVTRQYHSLPLEMLLYLALTVLVAIVGGLLPAVTAAVLASLALNWYFTQPTGTFTIGRPENVAALVLFVLVAAAVATVVHLTARRSVQASAAGRDAQLMAALAHSLLDAQEQLPALLEQARDTFAVPGAALVRTADRGSGRESHVVVASSGVIDVSDETRLTCADVGDDHRLALATRTVDARERRLVEAFADHAEAILHREELAAKADDAAVLAKDNDYRTALLAAVSHDLRTPLSAIKAGVSGLRSTDIELSRSDQVELLETVEESTDRLDALIENLLDMSRIQTGSLTVRRDETLAADLIEGALHSVTDRAQVEVRQPDPHLTCAVDPGLAERVLANLIENAIRHTPNGTPVAVDAEDVAGHVEFRVVDRGPGVPPARREAIFAPFQRYGDAPRGGGIGLGLAVAKGLSEAMGATLTADDTPGGGLTMTVRLS
ncbi:ATP-binding protein [Allobranchiibius sp. GilTou73]|uniref:ATP-binding protein n=1 Tax=Allobranchiibius sp. GilTou73 TaxID=2904523 RepID=UPI001F36383F|nr:ATP-binding protein [Allobranchiibius sp. GilTou73]UIJ34117.1 DUF4118 domain-containing protein [Allobranchiibius sp. GilTou73]